LKILSKISGLVEVIGHSLIMHQVIFPSCGKGGSHEAVSLEDCGPNAAQERPSCGPQSLELFE
jgi:hypothetical protein